MVAERWSAGAGWGYTSQGGQSIRAVPRGSMAEDKPMEVVGACVRHVPRRTRGL